MCGLAGFAGISGPTRMLLAYALGTEIDVRGGDAIGFVTLRDGKPIHGKKSGEWSGAKRRFWAAVASGETSMLHARFATCGLDRRSVLDAHPFVIRRRGRTLYGAHNGMIYDARESAVRHKRPYTVDSKELYELLADGQFASISQLSGYGVLTWVDSDDLASVHLARISDNGEIYVVALASGGYVWGSTRDIVHSACEFAEVDISEQIEIATGIVHTLSADGVFALVDHPRVEVDCFRRTTRREGSLWDAIVDDDDDDDNDALTDEYFRLTSNAADDRAFNEWLASK